MEKSKKWTVVANKAGYQPSRHTLRRLQMKAKAKGLVSDWNYVHVLDSGALTLGQIRGDAPVNQGLECKLVAVPTGEGKLARWEFMTEREYLDRYQQEPESVPTALYLSELSSWPTEVQADMQASVDALLTQCTDNDPEHDCKCGGVRGQASCMFDGHTHTTEPTLHPDYLDADREVLVYQGLDLGEAAGDRTATAVVVMCNCGADRTGPTAEAHAAGCPEADVPVPDDNDYREADKYDADAARDAAEEYDHDREEEFKEPIPMPVESKDLAS